MTDKTAIAEYSPTEAALAALREKFAGVAFDLRTAAGDKEARAARQDLMKLRTGLEAKRKQIKAPALAYAKAIDTEAKRIEAEILALEKPIDDQIKAEERRKADEKAAAERAEAARVADLRERIAEIAGAPLAAIGKGSAAVLEILTATREYEIGEDFAEFTMEAQVAKDRAVAQLAAAHDDAVRREQEQARQQAERAELERQRAEQEKAAAELREQAAELARQQRAMTQAAPAAAVEPLASGPAQAENAPGPKPTIDHAPAEPAPTATPKRAPAPAPAPVSFMDFADEPAAPPAPAPASAAGLPGKDSAETLAARYRFLRDNENWPQCDRVWEALAHGGDALDKVIDEMMHGEAA